MHMPTKHHERTAHNFHVCPKAELAGGARRRAQPLKFSLDCHL